jgi:hypothetical protein
LCSFTPAAWASRRNACGMIVGESRLPWTPVKSALGVAGAEGEVVAEEWLECGADRDDALTAALREEEAVTFALAVEVGAPDIVSFGRVQQAPELALIQNVGQHLAVLRRSEHQRRVSLERLVLDAEAEEAFERRNRPRLASERGPPLRLGGEEAAQIARPNLT